MCSRCKFVLGLFEALRFGYHVMGIPFESNLMYDRRLQERAKRFIAHSAQIKQAEPLSVELVARLENLVASGTLGIVDRYLLGGLLFAIFSRSRWSDLKNLQSIWIDSFEDGSGFVEARTMDHKTSHTVQTKRRAMPLVAPFPGVSEHAWVRSWWAAGEALGVVWAKIPFGPLVRVPDRNGKLCERRWTSTEAGNLLCLALDLAGPDRRTSHCLKPSTGWENGAWERETASSRAGSVVSPVRAYQAMLLEIRRGVFRPDASRSGWLRSDAPAVMSGRDVLQGAVVGSHSRPESSWQCADSARASSQVPEEASDTWADVQWPSDTDALDADELKWYGREPFERQGPVGAVEDPALCNAISAGECEEAKDCDSSASSSPSSESSSSVQEERMMDQVGVARPYEIDEPCWQRRKSKMLHRPAGGRADGRTKCGRRANEAYTWLEGAFASWTRCSLCWKGELIATRSQLIDAIDARRKNTSSQEFQD